MSLFYTEDLMRADIENLGYQVGKHSYGAPNILAFGEGKKVYIGKYCSIALNVTVFLGGNHRLDWCTTYPFPALTHKWPEAAGVTGHPLSNGDVRIANDVWLGQNSTIMSGLTVGDGAVVGASSLVTKDVPPYAIVGGNPARIIKYRFSPELIRRFLQIKWWDWPETQVRSLLPDLVSSDIEGFLSKAERL